jgi:hypothetical protein
MKMQWEVTGAVSAGVRKRKLIDERRLKVSNVSSIDNMDNEK